jgi:RNA polymerase sigma factor (sigma-70 family)
MFQHRFTTPVVAEIPDSRVQGATPAEPMGGRRPVVPATEIARLVRAAAAGDERAWDALVTCYTPLIRAIARRFRLAPCDQDDVLQRTWLALFGHIGRLNTPEAISGWLATAARNECLRALRAARRELPVEELPERCRREEPEHVDGAFDEAVLNTARATAVRAAVRRLDGRKQALLELLMEPSEPSYLDISARLGVPVGSIGPTRARSLARLRRDPELAGLFDDSPRRPHATRPPRPHPPEIL